ncbi:MAG: FAD-dependent oxidoreductase [Deltaproteobacteria bacterium]|jgi:protoporphyrinogen oxidase|nr:FAD-dependent oxidoreductase [Deltaproteobacteria bacterium]
MKKIAIIGAGAAGLTAAFELSKDPATKVVVYEASDSVGGMCKSLRLWDCIVDLGPHRFFSYDTRVNKLWLEVVGQDYKMVNRLTRIYYNKKFFLYPIAPFDALTKVGCWTAAQCVLAYLKEKIIPTKQDGSFETWVTRRFGKKLYQMFFKTYSEKLWGVSCRNLDDDFAAQRIKNLSLMAVILNAFKIGKTSHKTLVDEFAYPVGGTGSMYQRMADAVLQRGGTIYYNHSVQGVVVRNNVAQGVLLNDNKTVEPYDEVISTMSLTDALNSMQEVPAAIKAKAEKLCYRNTVMVYLKVEGTDLFSDNWLYVHSPELHLGRITNFRNWVPELYGENDYTILALEYWCYNEDKLWQYSNEEYICLATNELEQTGLLKRCQILAGFVYKIPKSYPTYHKDYRNDLQPIEQYLRGIKNCHFIGRYGAFKYNNQDHSILMGWMLAQNLLGGKNYDLWSVNTDYDNYQEGSLITKTGLISK